MRRLVASLPALLGAMILSACGGGGGSGGGAPPDSTPDAFAFTAQPNALPAVAVESSTATIRGINQAVAVSVTGGEYSINGGAYTSTSGTLSEGATVRTRITSSATLGQTASVTLTVGGVSARFDCTTRAELAPPTIRIDYPGGNVVTHDTTFAIRGTVMDASGVSSVTVNGASVPILASGTNATFSASITLAENDSTQLLVQAVDSLGNATPGPTAVTVRHTPLMGTPKIFAVNSDQSRFYVLQGLAADVYEVDPSIGRVTRKLATLGSGFNHSARLAFDSANQRVLALADDGNGTGRIAEIPLGGGAVATFGYASPVPLGARLKDVQYRPEDQSLYYNVSVASQVLQVTAPVGLVGANFVGPVIFSAIPGIRAFTLMPAGRLLLLHTTSDPNVTQISHFDLASHTVSSRFVAATDLAVFRNAVTIDYDHARNEALLIGPDQLINVTLDTTSYIAFPPPTVDSPYVIRSPVAHVFAPGSASVLFTDTNIPFIARMEHFGARSGQTLASIGSGVALHRVTQVAFDPATGNAYLVDDGIDGPMGEYDIVRIDANGNAVVLARHTQTDLEDPRDLLFDAAGARLLLLERDRIESVALSDGAIGIVSNNTGVGAGPAFVNAAKGTLDPARNRVLLVDEGNGALLSIDLATGERSLVSRAGARGTGPALGGFGDVALSPGALTAYVLNDSPAKTLVAVDLASGDRTLALDHCPLSNVGNADLLTQSPVQELTFNSAGTALLISLGITASWTPGASTCTAFKPVEETVALDIAATPNGSFLAGTFNALVRYDELANLYVVLTE